MLCGVLCGRIFKANKVEVKGLGKEAPNALNPQRPNRAQSISTRGNNRMVVESSSPICVASSSPPPQARGDGEVKKAEVAAKPQTIRARTRSATKANAQASVAPESVILLATQDSVSVSSLGFGGVHFRYMISIAGGER